MNRKEQTIAIVRRRHEAHLVAPRRKPPRQQHPLTIQLDYWHAIQPLVDRTHALIQRDLMPTLARELAEHARERGDGLIDLTDKLHKLAKAAADLIEPKQLWWLADQYGKRTADFQKAQLGLATRAVLGVDLASLEPNVTAHVGGWVAQNVGLIKSIPQQYASDVEGKVLGAVRSGTRWETLAGEIEDRYGIATRRAQLIARDQVGKLYGNLNEERQTALGVTGYVWRTSQDSRVRDEHEEREGETFEWDDAPEDGHPGEAVNCRCYAEPDFSGIVEGLSEAP